MNPYQGPNPYGPPQPDPGMPNAPSDGPQMNRTPFVLAGIGALLASVYWAGLTLLIGVGVATGATSAMQVILPIVLIVLYALRGFQLFKGDPAAAKRILWLHGVGGVMALINITSGGTLLTVLQSIKLLIHVFGGATAYLAMREFNRSQRSQWRG